MNVTAIPAELRERPRWVLFRFVPVPNRPKPKKVPYQVRLPHRRASSTDPSTWATFDEALARLEAGEADAIGYALSAEDPYFGLDLDDGLSGADKAAIVDMLDTYTERSVSGEGFHLIGRGCLNGQGRHPHGFGAFDRGRFFIFTGDHVLGTPETIEERQEQLDEVLARYAPRRPSSNTPPRLRAPLEIDDRELLERMFHSKHGNAIRELWNGNWEGRYLSQSEADLALCAWLAFWTRRDACRVDRLFRSSGLYRK